MKRSSRNSRKGARTHGFTLLEVIVAVLVGLVLLAALWSFFHHGLRRTASTGGRLRGVLGAHVLVEYLEHDLKRIYHDRPVPGRDADRFVIRPKVEPSGDASLDFWIFDETRSDLSRGFVRVSPVRYAFRRATGKVKRSGPEGETTFQGFYERIVFGVHPNRGDRENTPFPYLDYPPYKALTAAAKPPVSAVVTYQITCVPAKVFLKAPALRKPAERTTVWGGVVVSSKVGAESQHTWLPNWSSLPRP